MAAVLPLSALLSQALVAFTIEFDNEFERQTPHRTTNHKSGSGPWLTSMVMWSNCMRFAGSEGIAVRELEARARTRTNWNGMVRWGYVAISPGPAGRRTKQPQGDWVIRATAKGLRAREVWRPLFGAIERRWRERFGEAEIGQLQDALAALSGQMDPGLPDCLPILGYGLNSLGPDAKVPAPAKGVDTGGAEITLPGLLSRVLLAFAIEFERESDLSLAISANVVRVLDQKGVRIRDLPRLAGVSKEAIATAVGFLQKRGFAVVEPEQAGSRLKAARLTVEGRDTQSKYLQLPELIEERWQERFGKGLVSGLRRSLERLAGDGQADSPLFRGLEPYPDGWRASVRKPATLPHYPMVLHRGGFPDGS